MPDEISVYMHMHMHSQRLVVLVCQVKSECMRLRSTLKVPFKLVWQLQVATIEGCN